MGPCGLRCTAAEGTSTTPFSVSTTMRTFTNWLGKSFTSALGNCAFSFTVPVVRSIWLSTVTSAPVASRFLLSRSHASTGGLSPAFRRAMMRGSVSWGIVKSTAMGASCVITAMPLGSEPCTMLPGSTSLSPTRPATGAVMRVYESCSFALSTCAWSIFTVPSSCFTGDACWSTCWGAIESWASSVR